MSDLVRRLVQEYTALWWESDASASDLGPRYTPGEQSQREAHLAQFQSAVASEAERAPRTRSARQATHRRLLSASRTFAKATLGLEERHIDVLLDRGLAEIGCQFARTACRFDSNIRARDIFQALRNVWTTNGLQLLLGVPLQLTPAIFAYSMLYPYTDNYLDDSTISLQDKKAFNARFALRLSGEDIYPINAHEQIIYNLVSMIETQFERSHYPEVFESLYAIHQAQCRSLRLLHRDASPYEVDVLGISFEKGGASVLADAYLVASSLTRDQAACAFGWGAFVQLVDDLQDVEEDTQEGLLTVFSQTAKHWSLDGVTDRVLHFGAKVVERLDCFNALTGEPVKELMRRSAAQLLIEAAGAAGQFYTGAYLQEIEPHSPVRFAFLREQRGQAADRRAPLTRLLEAFASFDDETSPLPFPLP